MYIFFDFLIIEVLIIFNILYYMFFDNFSYLLLNNLKFKLLDSGPIILKLVQWSISKVELQYPKLKNKLDCFKDVYEDCKQHHLTHTLKCYKNEFNSHLCDDYEILNKYPIKSGSIAQVYVAKCKNTGNLVAIKSTHPFDKSLFNISILFFKVNMFLFELIFSYNFFCSKIDDLIIWIKEQLNLTNEFNNLSVFYKIYKDNKYIIIPKPIKSSRNILIMSYEYAENIEQSKISLYHKNKLLLLLVAFIKNNLYIHKIAHCDMHIGNWKIKKIDNNYAICIYDYGLCALNIVKEISNYLDNWVLKDYEKLTEFNINNIIVNKNKRCVNKKVLFNNLKQIAISSKGKFDDYISKLLRYHSTYNYFIPIEKINIFISLILLQKIFKKYGILDATENSSDFYFSDTNSLITLCETLDTMPELKKYLKTLFINLKKKNFYKESIAKNKKKIINDNSSIVSSFTI